MCVFSIGSRRRTKRQEKMMLSPASSGKGRSKRRFFEGSSQCLSGLVLVKVWWWTHIYFGNNFTMSQHKDAETPRAGGEKCKQENRSCKRHGYDPVPVPLAHETCPSVPGTNKRHICQTHRKYIPDPAFTTIPSSLIPAVLWLYLFLWDQDLPQVWQYQIYRYQRLSYFSKWVEQTPVLVITGWFVQNQKHRCFPEALFYHPFRGVDGARL